MTGIDELFAMARRGDGLAFADWAGRIERPVRASVRRFAAHVDLEVVVQETLLRMWLMASSTQRTLEGENASLRMALRVARNVAREELRRARRGSPVQIEEGEDLPELAVQPAPGPDPALGRAIRACIERLPERLRTSLLRRLELGHAMPDRDLAERLGLKLNTFLQHIVRARKHVADCLAHKGVDLVGVVS